MAVENPFTRHGFLPKGAHPYTLERLQEDFVFRYPSSIRRPAIYQGFTALRTDILALGIHGVQYIDGSFVTDVKEPDDIDVITLIDGEWLNNASGSARAFVDEVLRWPKITKKWYFTDSIFIPMYPMNHPSYEEFVATRDFFLKWFGRPWRMPYGKGVPSRYEKGYACIYLGDIEV